MNLSNASLAYGWLMFAGVAVSLSLWWRVAQRDHRLIVIYFSALGGAIVGAKLSYLLAEGWLYWHDPHRWLILATGKSITGALLGGYAAVEFAKRRLHYSGTTGDWFAVLTPLGVLLGRIGCTIHGCCLGRQCEPAWYSLTDVHGVARWPAAQMEGLFNAVALVVILCLRQQKRFSGQLFHLYLIAYGIFRFLHEFLRDTPPLWGPFSGYQAFALGMVALGVTGYHRRARLGKKGGADAKILL